MSDERPEREYNARGFFVIGPQARNPSDVLAMMIANAQLSPGEHHFATSLPEQRRAIRIYSGRLAKRIRDERGL